MLSKTYSKALLIFILSSSFYLYEFILQVAPGVMMKDIMDSFGVGAVGFSTISAFYFYAYAPMQLPAGVLFDRYGPKILITLALIICGLGCLFFALSSSSFLASLGRFLIGFGSAFSFIGILILVSRWFPASQFALYVGIAQLLASVGAICGESPLAYMSELVGWRYSMMILSVIGLILAFLVWLFVEDHPEVVVKQTSSQTSKSKTTFLGEFRRLLIVCQDRQTWWIGIYSFCSWTTMTVFAGLWVVPYLQHVYHFSVLTAAQASIFLWLGVGIGSPVLGYISDQVQNRRWPLIICMVVGLITSLIMILNHNISWPWLLTLFFIIGLASSGQALSFALVKEHNKTSNAGSAAGFNNFAVVIGGAILQPIFGYVLTLYWDGKHEGITPVFPVEAYNNALWMLPICYVVGGIIAIVFIKETYGKGGSNTNIFD